MSGRTEGKLASVSPLKQWNTNPQPAHTHTHAHTRTHTRTHAHTHTQTHISLQWIRNGMDSSPILIDTPPLSQAKLTPKNSLIRATHTHTHTHTHTLTDSHTHSHV